jgi:hypothetical protein
VIITVLRGDLFMSLQLRLARRAGCARTQGRTLQADIEQVRSASLYTWSLYFTRATV